jgi:hypothetical protein
MRSSPCRQARRVGDQFRLHGRIHRIGRREKIAAGATIMRKIHYPRLRLRRARMQEACFPLSRWDRPRSLSSMRFIPLHLDPDGPHHRRGWRRSGGRDLAGRTSSTADARDQTIGRTWTGSRPPEFLLEHGQIDDVVRASPCPTARLLRHGANDHGGARRDQLTRNWVGYYALPGSPPVGRRRWVRG